MKRLFSGFTLAEVLITLGIIGVVAAVTLPSLQVNVNKQALSTQISKNYSQLQEGLKLYMMDNNLDELDESNLDLPTFARNYLQVQYVCNGSDDTSCFADKYTTISTSVSTTKTRKEIMSYAGSKAYILRDGTTIALVPATVMKQLITDDPIIKFTGAYLMAAASNTWTKVDPIGGKIDPIEAELVQISIVNAAIVDVNGKKGPNKIGYDLFQINLNSDGTAGPTQASAFADPTKRDAEIAKGFENCKNGKDLGGGCFTHLLRNNFKFDY